jgi:hypothetical protein
VAKLRERLRARNGTPRAMRNHEISSLAPAQADACLRTQPVRRNVEEPQFGHNGDGRRRKPLRLSDRMAPQVGFDWEHHPTPDDSDPLHPGHNPSWQDPRSDRLAPFCTGRIRGQRKPSSQGRSRLTSPIAR